MREQYVPFLVRTFFLSRSLLLKMLAGTNALAYGCFAGFWLGSLTRETLHAIDEEYYTRTKGDSDPHNLDSDPQNKIDYHSEEYNRRGLWEWEENAINTYFAGCERVLVLAAGGGREILALQRLGYAVDGFESHPALVGVANGLLQAEGYEQKVKWLPRDKPPSTATTYDGIVIGWGAYMLIQGRKNRIALLQQLRSQTQANCPLLLSFFYRTRTPSRVIIAALVANTIRRVLRRELVEEGDWLAPEYVHYFTEDEITSEVSQAGFRIVDYGTTGYGHAVAMAV